MKKKNRLKRKINIMVLLLLLFIIFASCTTTDAYTSVATNFSEYSESSNKFIITTDLLDNRESEKMEYAFIEALTEYGLVGYSWMDFFPPVKEYNSKEYSNIIDESNIDIIVYANLQDSSMQTGAYVNSTGVYPYTESFVMFEFLFEHINLSDPILVTQVKVDSDNDDWAHLNAAASERAVEEYALMAGLEPIQHQNW